MANEIEVEARCRVNGLRELSEDALCDLMETAASEVERRVPDVGPAVAIDGDVLYALGSFDLAAGRNPFEDAEVYVHELSAGLRVALTRMKVAEVTTTTRERVEAAA
jgi:hypothetical protein